MEKIKYIICLLVLLVCISGCGSTKKEDIDSNVVLKTLTESKLNVTDVKDQVGYAEEAYYGVDGEIKVNYVKGNKKYDIQGIFLDECKNVYSVCGNDYKKKTDGGDNWTRLEITNKDTYYFVGWVNDAYIIITSPIEYKKDMQSIVNKTGF